MRLVDGPNLAEVVSGRGPLDVCSTADLGLQLLDVLEAAHRQGLIHRDIKPANVMFPSDGRAQLTDFGIARLIDDPRNTTTGLVRGTPQYMSPEQAAGGQIGAATDLWSLGATLYYAVEGVPPFDKGHALATLTSITVDSPRPPHRAGPLDAVLRALLAKEPGVRSGDVDVRRRLRAVADSGAPTREFLAPWAQPSNGPSVPFLPGAEAGPHGSSVPDLSGRDVPSPGPASPEHEEPGLWPVGAEPAASVSPKSALEADAWPIEPERAASVELEPETGPRLVEAASRQPRPPEPDALDPGPELPLALGEYASPAWAEREDPQQEPPVGDGVKRHRFGPGRRMLATVGIVVAVVIAAAVVITANRGGSGHAPTPSTKPGAGHAAGPQSGGSTAANTSKSGGAAPASEGPANSSAVAVPASWATYTDPQTGFHFRYPPGWSVEPQGTHTTFNDPATGDYVLIDHQSPPAATPGGPWYQIEPGFSASHSGYQRLGITTTQFHGFPAALWEYEYSSGSDRLHAIDLGMIVGSHGYAFNFQSSEARWATLQPEIAQLEAGFAPAG